MGNFVFGSTHRSYHPYSAIAQLSLNRQGLVNYKMIPVLINPPQVNYSPRLLDGEEKGDFIERITMEPIPDPSWTEIAKARMVLTPSFGY